MKKCEGVITKKKKQRRHKKKTSGVKEMKAMNVINSEISNDPLQLMQTKDTSYL